MYGVTTYLKVVKKWVIASEILEFIGDLFFAPLKGGITANYIWQGNLYYILLTFLMIVNFFLTN